MLEWKKIRVDMVSCSGSHARTLKYGRRTGTLELLALPLYRFFLPSGHARASYVTTLPLFSPKRVRESFLRYRSTSFFSRAGMRELLALPLYLFFLPSGYARASCVTAPTLFSPERVRESFSRYLFTAFFSRAGTRELLALPLYRFFLPSGHARASYVTTLPLFSPERVRESFLRYRSTSFFSRAGMREPLALPLLLFFLPSGYARASCVTAPTLFSRIIKKRRLK